MMRHWKISLLLPIWFLLAYPALSADVQVIGVVKTLKGSVSIRRGQQAIPAAIGAKLQVNDVIETAADSSIGMILRDDSLLSMGPNSHLAINEFVFSPYEGKLGFLIKIMRGTVDYVSGIIVKLSPRSGKFETPVATIGARGTRFAVKVE
jgi:hypothetical protein